MRIKTHYLTGAALDWAVCSIEGQQMSRHTRYSTDWAHGGPIIEREQLWVQPEVGKGGTASAWYAVSMRNTDAYGSTPLIAAMRAYVASKLGDEVDIPEELK